MANGSGASAIVVGRQRGSCVVGYQRHRRVE